MTTFKSGSDYFKRKIKAKFERLRRDPSIVLRPAADSAHADQVARIFEEGQKTDGTKIGDYASQEYVALRRRKGRETSFINLRLSGNLMKDYANGNKTRKKGRKLVASVKRQRNARLIEKNEDRFGDIFSLTTGERATFLRIARQETIRYLNA